MSKRRIYFIKPIGMPGPVKIGISSCAERRLDDLMTWSPFPLEIVHSIPGDYKLERSIQEALANDHLHREWFQPTARVLKLLNDLGSGVGIAEAIDLSKREGAIVSPRPTLRSRRRHKASPTTGLTEGQHDCLRFIQGYAAKRGRVPTYQQIADGIGIRSKSGVHRYITALEERGRIKRVPFVTAGYSLVEPIGMAEAA